MGFSAKSNNLPLTQVAQIWKKSINDTLTSLGMNVSKSVETATRAVNKASSFKPTITTKIDKKSPTLYNLTVTAQGGAAEVMGRLNFNRSVSAHIASLTRHDSR